MPVNYDLLREIMEGFNSFDNVFELFFELDPYEISIIPLEEAKKIFEAFKYVDEEDLSNEACFYLYGLKRLLHEAIVKNRNILAIGD